jgi:hypothetical protein
MPPTVTWRKPLLLVEELNYILMRAQEHGWDDWRLEEAWRHGYDPNDHAGRTLTLYDFGD